LKLAPLFAIEALAFVLIIAESYVFFMVVVPIQAVPHDILRYTAYTLLKLALTLGLGALWFVLIIGATRFYVRSKLKTENPEGK
jgi:hypothetical protein